MYCPNGAKYDGNWINGKIDKNGQIKFFINQ